MTVPFPMYATFPSITSMDLRLRFAGRIPTTAMSLERNVRTSAPAFLSIPALRVLPKPAADVMALTSNPSLAFSAMAAMTASG